MDAFAWPDLLSAVATVGAIGAIGWLWSRRQRRVAPVRDEPGEMPYRVFTTDFDRVVDAHDAPALLADEDRIGGVGTPRNVPGCAEQLAAAAEWPDSLREKLRQAGADLTAVLASHRGNAAVMLLIDHSGSMKGHMVPVAATVRWLSERCDAHGIALAIAGFTTLGWRGGESRRRWIAAGRPQRPGRLCALLHLRYRQFGARLAEEDWRVMLDPTVLRENIDGEAIAWAASELRQRPERQRLLVVVSDGAPVDDSTLAENGPSFLERDILRTVAAIESSRDIRLAAIGVEHQVDRYYRCSRAVTDLAELPGALVGVLGDALATPA